MRVSRMRICCRATFRGVWQVFTASSRRLPRRSPMAVRRFWTSGSGRWVISRATAATMPPALTTGSGAQVIPREYSRSATESSVSWLLAGPTMARQRRDGTVFGVRMPPSAAGTRMSASLESRRAGSAVRAGQRLASRWRSGSVSATTRVAPWRASASAIRTPTWPSPWMAKVSSLAGRPPKTRSRTASMQASVPAAVGDEESPLPPACCGRHRTWLVWRAMTAMSSGEVPTSGPVMYLPPSESMASPMSASRSLRQALAYCAAVPGESATTVFPPP